MKRKLLFLLCLIPLLSTLNAIEIYDKKKISIQLNTEVTTEYNYETNMFPGLSSFEVPSAEISLEAEYYNDFHIVISADLADYNLKNAYISYKFDDYLYLKSGKFKVKFGQEYTANYRPRTTHSDATDNFAPGRSSGISAYGKDILNLFDYNFSFTNDYNSDEGNETGQHVLTLMLDQNFIFKKIYKIKTGYEILYNTDETFAHGIFAEISNTDDLGLYILLEYMEQRYYHYYWNRSFFISSAYRFNDIEPFIHFEYYDDYIGEDTDDDVLVSGFGLNKYKLKDRLKFTFSYINRFSYTETDTFEWDYISNMEHTITLQAGFTL